MNIRIYSFSDRGRLLAKKLLNLPYRVEESNTKKIKRDFYNSDALIFISAMGIAVRLIAPYIKDKKTDPAVIVLDDTGKYTISLLSGHLGGANKLTLEIAEFLDNQAIITTASDNRNMEALDNFAKENDLYITNFNHLKKVMSDIINEAPVGLYSEIKRRPKNIKFIEDKDFNSDKVSSWVIISSENIETIKPKAHLIPKNLNIGIGLRKDTPYEDIKEVFDDALRLINHNIKGIKTIATIPLKKDEAGLKRLVDELGMKLSIYDNEEINKVEIEEPSDFVYKTTGVYAVSEPCALLSGGEMILRKYRDKKVTISIAKEVYDE